MMLHQSFVAEILFPEEMGKEREKLKLKAELDLKESQVELE